jgi:CBS domain-containing protein
MPLIDGARLFYLSHGIKGINNTYTRFKQLAINDPKYSEIYLNCWSFLNFIKIKDSGGWKTRTWSIYKFGGVVKIDKEKCAGSNEELEELIKNKFQLTQFS